MRKEASLEMWRELYDLAIEIKKLEPWKYLWDMDLIEMHLPGYQEPVYCSVMGKGGECYGIGLYEGSEGLADFNMIATADKFMLPAAYVMGDQSNLSCYFGDREEVPREQKAVIKELGLKFRGRGQWIYFESFKKRYLSYIPDERETKVLLDTYRVLPIAIKAVIDHTVEIDWDDDEILSCRFDEDKKIWNMSAIPHPDCSRKYPYIQLTDDILKQKLKKMKRNKSEIALDLSYMHCGVTDDKYERPMNPMVLVAVDVQADMIIDMHMMDIEETEVDAILNFFIPFVMEYGRMKTIYARNPWIFAALSHICDFCGIRLVSDELEEVDGILEDMMSMMR
ncbi:hypothetical protein GPL15_11875 [Clostridium sp. MCC353]|uniref:DUF7309 domain-containing protein n=1 Tax=Clostridium sp. MCC353 TaxID=2592646 RepID=UPI001C022ACA|nr:hypothetical protein [Clostridium sp. MCC353]MBT9777201.1 hypothetical protein [Clostridium sp. MCC353]